MKLNPEEEVVSYETAMNIPDEKKNEDKVYLSQEDAKVGAFFRQILNDSSIDLKKYFTPEDIEKLKLLRINVRYNKLHSTFEVMALQADIRLYMPDPENNNEPYLDKPKGITDEEIERLFAKTLEILMQKR